MAVATFTSSPATAATGSPMTFDPAGSDAEGGTLSIDFGDGNTAVFVGLTPLTHSYAAAGEYVVTVTATPPEGPEASASSNVFVADPIPVVGSCSLVQGYLVESGAARIWGWVTSLPGVYEATWTATPVAGGMRFTVASTFLDTIPTVAILVAGLSVSDDGDINLGVPTDLTDPITEDVSLDSSTGVTLAPSPFVWPLGTVGVYEVVGGVLPAGSSYTVSFTVPAIYATSFGVHFPFLVLDDEEQVQFYNPYVGLAWISNDCDLCSPGTVSIPGTLVDAPVTFTKPSGDPVVLQMVGNASDIVLPQGQGFIADGSLYPAQPTW